MTAAIVEALHAHPNGNGSLPTTDRKEFVREVLTLIHVRRISFFSSMTFIPRLVVRSDGLTLRSCIDYGPSIVPGRAVVSIVVCHS